MDCGKAIEYAEKKPNFCDGCGASLTGKKAPVQTAKKVEEEMDNEDEEAIAFFRTPKFDPNDLVLDVKPKLTFVNIVNTAGDRPVDVRPGVGKNGLQRIRESVKSLKQK